MGLLLRPSRNGPHHVGQMFFYLVVIVFWQWKMPLQMQMSCPGMSGILLKSTTPLLVQRNAACTPEHSLIKKDDLHLYLEQINFPFT